MLDVSTSVHVSFTVQWLKKEKLVNMRPSEKHQFLCLDFLLSTHAKGSQHLRVPQNQKHNTIYKIKLSPPKNYYKTKMNNLIPYIEGLLLPHCIVPNSLSNFSEVCKKCKKYILHCDLKHMYTRSFPKEYFSSPNARLVYPVLFSMLVVQ